MIRRLLVSLAFMALAGCATPSIQSALTPVSGFSGPHLEDDAFVSFDGARLGLSKWEAEGEPWAVIIGLHGMNDYGQGFWRAGPYWASQGVTTYAYDQRGYGRSPNRGVWAGQDLIDKDVTTMVAVAKAKHPNAIIAVAGVSMGGAAAITAFAGRNPPDADRVILLSPAVWGWSTQPLPNRLALWIANKARPAWEVNPPRVIVQSHVPTDNREELQRMSTDPLMLYGARADTLNGMTNLMQAAWRDTGRIKVPTLYLYGYRDVIIPRQAATQAAARLRDGNRTGFYLDGYHLLLSDNQARRVWDDVLGFLHDPSKPLVSGVPPIPAR